MLMIQVKRSLCHHYRASTIHLSYRSYDGRQYAISTSDPSTLGWYSDTQFYDPNKSALNPVFVHPSKASAP